MTAQTIEPGAMPERNGFSRVVPMPEEYFAKPAAEPEGDAGAPDPDDDDPSGLVSPGDVDPEELSEGEAPEDDEAQDGDGQERQTRSIDEWVELTLEDVQRLAEIAPRQRTEVMKARDAAVNTYWQGQVEQTAQAAFNQGVQQGRTVAIEAMEYEHVKGLNPYDQQEYFKENDGAEDRYLRQRLAEKNPRRSQGGNPQDAALTGRAVAVGNLTKGNPTVYAQLEANRNAGRYPLTEAGIARLEQDAAELLANPATPKNAAKPSAGAAAVQQIRKAPRTPSGGGTPAASSLTWDALSAMSQPDIRAYKQRPGGREEIQRVLAGGPTGKAPRKP